MRANTQQIRMDRRWLAGLCGLSFIVLAGCHQDMWNQDRYTALQATVGANPWLTDETPVTVTVTTTTLDGVGQRAERRCCRGQQHGPAIRRATMVALVG